GNKISLTVFPESKEFVSGVMYIKDISVFSEHREYGKNIDHLAFSGEKREYIIRVKKSLFDDLTENLGYKSDEFFPVSELSDQLKSDWKIRENSRIMISRFDSLSTEIFIDLGKTYTIASKWITPAQKVGNLSDHILVSNIPSDDHSAPLVLDSFEKVAYLYKKNRISLSNILDLGGNDVMLEWDTDNNGSYETSGNSFLTEVYREPFSEKIPVKISDASGNFTETFVTIIYKAPPVFLNDIDDIQKISGYISPKYAGAPVTLLRERYGQTKKIITDSLVKTQGDEFFTTDEDGKFLVQNIDLSPNVWIRDKAGNVIGEVLAHTGKLVSRDEKYHVDLIEGRPEKSGNNNKNRMRQVLLDTNNTIVANALVHTFSENSVQKISKTPGFTEENTQFSGSYVLDTNPSDSIVSGLLPLVAPENSGGRVIFDKISGKSLAHIFRDGNIIFFPNSDLKIQLSGHHNNEEKNLIIDVYQKNTKIFEVMLVTNEVKNTENNSEKIEINRNTNMGGALAFFSPENFPEFQKPLLSALDSTLKLQLPFSDVDKNSEYYEPLAELFSRNLISGYEDGTFQPDKKISRAEFVKIALGVTHCLDCLNPSDAEKSVFYEVNSF
ncbi:TPA: S-layer homology domain-containing protein, partial [Candidatus Peregrinibacteria bacterium]|nr:S-layer homology domain-containing protein [Candidatus Peregrinibacteria bacterium]